MKRHATIAACAALLVFWAAAAGAQAPPDFAGKWQLDVAKTKAENLSGLPGAGPFVTSLTLTLGRNHLSRTTEAPTEGTTTYSLDGSEQTLTTGRGQSRVKATREGAKIVIVATHQATGGEVRSVTEYTLEGAWLVIATTETAPGAGKPPTIKLYYRRAA